MVHFKGLKLNVPIVDDHVVMLNIRVIFGDSLAHIKKKSVGDFHDVLINGGRQLNFDYVHSVARNKAKLLTAL